MNRIGGTKRRAVWVGATLLVALAVVPAFVGTAGATAAPGVTPAVSAAWAYGGQNWSGGHLSTDNVTLTWNATVGEVVIFNETNTSSTTTELELQRTIMVALTISGSAGNVSASYSLRALEKDAAYANVTNTSTVYVEGSPVAALGLLNASVVANDSIAESLSVSVANLSESAAFNASALAKGSVSFSPSLGLVPLNLTGVSAWNSSAVATPNVSWAGGYAWMTHAINGTVNNGSQTFKGNLTATGTVDLNGYLVVAGLPSFHDHRARIGVLLAVTGPFDLYDGFLFLPHAFDFFGGGAQPFADASLGAATVSQETLYLTKGPIHPDSFTAAGTGFNATTSGAASMAAAVGESPAVLPASSDGGASVVMQPESTSQADAQAHCFDQYGCAAGPAGLGPLAYALIGMVVVASVGAIGWRAYRRRSKPQPGTGGNGQTGTPPAGAVVAPPTPPTGPTDPASALGPAPPQP